MRLASLEESTDWRIQWREANAVKPDSPRDDPPPSEPKPDVPTPWDVPAPEPSDVPAREPRDVPPPEAPIEPPPEVGHGRDYSEEPVGSRGMEAGAV